MAKMNIITTILLIELIMITLGAATINDNGNYGKKISIGCIATCAITCAESGEFMPVCMAVCLLVCSGAPNSGSPVVKNCASNCAQATCSKFIGDARTMGQCVADNCIDKCLTGA